VTASELLVVCVFNVISSVASVEASVEICVVSGSRVYSDLVYFAIVRKSYLFFVCYSVSMLSTFNDIVVCGAIVGRKLFLS
jgi:hypothetical protein